MGNVQAQSLKHRALSISSIQLSLLGTVVEQSIFRPTLEGRYGVDTKRSRTVDTADRPLSAATAPFLCRCGRGPWRGLPATRGSQQSRIDWARALTRFRQCLRPKSLSRSRPAITVSLASWSGFRGETQTDCTVRFSATCSNCFSSVNPKETWKLPGRRGDETSPCVFVQDSTTHALPPRGCHMAKTGVPLVLVAVQPLKFPRATPR